MSVIRADHWMPEFVLKATLTAGQSFVSPSQLQNGAASVAVQIVLSGGAAATCYAEATNMDPNKKGAVWANCQSFVLAADASGYMIFSSVDQLTGMHAMRIRIEPTAGGTASIALNFRHYSN